MIGAPKTAPCTTICWPAWRSPSTNAAALTPPSDNVSVRAAAAATSASAAANGKSPTTRLRCPKASRHARTGAKPHSQMTPIRPIGVGCARRAVTQRGQVGGRAAAQEGQQRLHDEGGPDGDRRRAQAGRREQREEWKGARRVTTLEAAPSASGR